MSVRIMTLFFIFLCIAACGARETLLAKPAAVPAGVDLSGQWRLSETSGSEQPKARDMLVHVFLETGKSIKITQTANGLFLSFDRSVVEEYRFGEHRDVSVGEISADRVSGWEGGAYVIETLDKDGVRLIDSYRLVNGQAGMKRTIRIQAGSAVHLSLEQLFERI